MFLSNSRRLFIVTAVFTLFSLGCSSSPANENANIALRALGKGAFPFSTIEPEVFQGEFVVTSGGSEKRWFIARSGDRWRFDIFEGIRPALTQLRSDKIYLIDHFEKTYCEDPQVPGTPAVDSVLSAFYRHKTYQEFEDLGSEGGIRKFRVKTGDNAKEDVVVSIDEASGTIIRQEFYRGTGEAAVPAFTYEVRGFKTTVDEGVLDIPSGYKLVGYEELIQTRRKRVD